MKKKNLVLKLTTLTILLLVVFGFKNNILRSFSHFLIIENEFDYIENAFVLSGGAFDRGNEATFLFQEKKIGNIICTGENKPPDFKAINLEMLESEVTRKNIISQINDSAKVTLLKIGTSTLEESEIILEYCLKHSLKECLIISSKFHTRRINNVFKKKFEKKGIQVFIKGAASSAYVENEWWKSENGLIALNNEYIKLFYYFVKY